MDKNKIKTLWTLFGFPAALIVFGLILVASPDSAIMLVTRLLAWIFVIYGAACIIGILVDKAWGQPGKWVWPVICLAVGTFFLRRPMLLADVIGRVIGVLLTYQGMNDLRRSHYGASKILAVVSLVAGAILIFLPRTLTQTIIGVCGLVLIIIGIENLLNKLREYKLLEQGSDPDIIDADE